MQEKFKKSIWLHSAVTLAVLVLYIALDTANDFRLSTILDPAVVSPFNLADAIKTRIYFLWFFVPALIPLLATVLWVHKSFRQNLLARFFLPLAGTLLAPGIMYVYVCLQDDRWRGLLMVEILMVNIFVFIANEILLFLNLRKL